MVIVVHRMTSVTPDVASQMNLLSRGHVGTSLLKTQTDASQSRKQPMLMTSLSMMLAREDHSVKATAVLSGLIQTVIRRSPNVMDSLLRPAKSRKTNQDALHLVPKIRASSS